MRRRALVGALLGGLLPAPLVRGVERREAPAMSAERDASVAVLLSGDVMTGRGIDQALPHAGDPQLFEPYVRNAREYVRLAEEYNGPLELPLTPAYIWGDALAAAERLAADCRVVNLETSITTSDRMWRGKGIHYRMHPDNIDAITVAGIDCCALANNHVLDWGYPGLEQTLATLTAHGVAVTGAGRDAEAAATPAMLPVRGGGRVVVYACGVATSGIPEQWAAGAGRAGVNLLPDLSQNTADRVAARIGAVRTQGDVVVVSIHWGGNWGYEVPAAQRAFAHRLIDAGAADIVHGHSSHHPKGIEIHRGRPILYGCGDLINDYEGIGGHAHYRGELRLLYCVRVDARTGELEHLEMAPFAMKRFRLQRAAESEIAWLAALLDREGERFGTRVEQSAAGTLRASPR